ncbi:MAG: phosphoribosylglycinamide formyltransferase [Methanoregulaceae archaeon]|nr:phosphoribosylglycinamide formyltransferase [Methanoregulaceae archaeon]
MKSVTVLASGRGSNFQAIIDAVSTGELRVECAGLITDNPEAYAIERARAARIPVSIVDYHRYPGKGEYEKALREAMEATAADLYVLAGYMRILGTGIVRHFPGRIINIHPALLPSFPGLHAQSQAIGYGAKVAGCTVHFVNEEMDAGPIIVQECVRVLEDDTEETLAERILEREHKCLPRAIQMFCDGRLRIEGRRVRITGSG